MTLNHIKLRTQITYGNLTMIQENFWLDEFAMAEGAVILHPSVPVSLEMTRYELNITEGEDVYIVVTDSTRSKATNNELGRRHGWTGHGGTVSKDSKHLVENGACAVDFYAVYAKSKKRVDQKTVAKIARKYFDWVNDKYSDGHVHGDNRKHI